MGRRRRAYPASDREISKSVATTEDIDSSGKLNPAGLPPRKFPGKREKVPDPVRKPLPSPSDGESQDDFIARCMSDLSSEFGDTEQRAAVCLKQWREEKTKADEIEDGGGVMIALDVPGEIAKSIAVDGGQDADSLHITLAYLGKAGTDIDKSAIPTVEKVVDDIAKSQPSALMGNIAGIGLFDGSPSSDGRDVAYAPVDVPGLVEFRQEIVSGIKKEGIRPSELHGFTPHITLAYLDEDQALPPKVRKVSVEFDQVSVASGSHVFSSLIGPARLSKNLYSKIVKAEKRLVTGIVLQPDVVDAQGDIIRAEVIMDAAHNFLSKFNLVTKMGLQHKHTTPNVKLVESYIAPIDMKIGKKLISKGTWLITVKVLDDQIWAAVTAGKITGFSIGGMAKTQRI